MRGAPGFQGVDGVTWAGAACLRVVTFEARFVRDRGAGFYRSAVSADRRGIVESIEARMTRAGGSATIVTAPGEGTEIELTLPRRPQ